MDCSSARLCLDFIRTEGRELDGPEAADLEAHLAHCGECQAAAAHLRFDRQVGKAMRAVEVPRGLKDQILQRLAAEDSVTIPGRAGGNRRWTRHLRTGLAAAAAVLAVTATWLYFFPLTRPEMSADRVCLEYNLVNKDASAVTEEFARVGIRTQAPNFVNYAYLSGFIGEGIIPAEAVSAGSRKAKPVKVPRLDFKWKIEGKVMPEAEAAVFIIPQRQFEVPLPESHHEGYPYRLDVYPHEKGDYVYVILHTGGDWKKWLYERPQSE